ncbi:unnamed protein product, partial [Rotaria socialis]
WSRHNIRSARGNEAKNQTIAQMGDDEAFCTFDWGQKILPQEYREKQNCLGKTNVPNISTIRSIEYNAKSMKVFKASNIGECASVPYKNIDFSTNMRLVSAFTVPINDEDHAIVPKNGCSSTFEFSAKLDSHISANLHKVPPPNPRTSNDMVRLHLIEAVRSINTQTNRATDRVRKQNDIIDGDVSNSVHAQHISSAGRTLLTRKHNNTMSEKTINFIEDISLNSHKNGSKLTPDQAFVPAQSTNSSVDLGHVSHLVFYVTVLFFTESALITTNVGFDDVPIHKESGLGVTIANWKNFMRDFCVEYFIQHPTIIGGIGHIVEIDESAQGLNENIIEVISTNSLCLVITTIYCDQWAAYNALSHPNNVSHRYGNQTVNHSVYFVDPTALVLKSNSYGGERQKKNGNHSISCAFRQEPIGKSSESNRKFPAGILLQILAISSVFLQNTLFSPHFPVGSRSIRSPESLTWVHTQNIENIWMVAQIKKKNQMKQYRTSLGGYLLQFMWRRRFGNLLFESLICLIQQQYPVTQVGIK